MKKLRAQKIGTYIWHKMHRMEDFKRSACDSELLSTTNILIKMKYVQVKTQDTN